MDFVHSERVNLEKNNKKPIAKKKIIFWTIISLIGAILIIGAITATVLIIQKRKKKKNENENENENGEIEAEKTDNTNENEIQEKKPLEKEFEIITNLGELKRVSVVQKSIEESKINNTLF